MSKFERKIVDFFVKNMDVLFVIIISIIGLVVRYFLCSIESDDATHYLIPWYEEIERNGGMRGLNHSVGNYNLLYQTIIAIMTYLPFEPLIKYKLLSVIFDYLLAASTAYLSYVVMSKESEDKEYIKKRVILVYSIVLLSITVVLNSSAWAQCDSIYTAFVILAVTLLIQNKNWQSFVMLGIAFSFKLQAVFIIPFFMLYYLKKKSFCILQFFYIPLILIISGIPAFIMGRPFKEVFSTYYGQARYGERLYWNYPTFWTFITNINSGKEGVCTDYYSYRNMAIVITIVILLILFYILMSNKIVFTVKNCLYIAFILTYTCVIFLPCMHERYGYIFEVLSIVIIFINRKTLFLSVTLHTMTLYLYASFLNKQELPCDMRIFATLNLIVYSIYLFTIIQELLKNNESQDIKIPNSVG